MTMPWWGWVLLALIPVIAVLGLAAASFRRRVRVRFVAFLQDRRPELQILSVSAWDIKGRDPNGTEWSLALDRLYQAASHARTPEDEETVFAEWAGAAGEVGDMGSQPLSLEQHGDRLRPMLALPQKRKQITRTDDLPFTPVPALGLEILYVVDAEHSVTYLTEPLMQDLGLALDALHARAMDNLRGTFPADEGFKWNRLPSPGSSGPLRLLKGPVKVTCEGFELM